VTSSVVLVAALAATSGLVGTAAFQMLLALGAPWGGPPGAAATTAYQPHSACSGRSR
jgi:hypothetical protein